MSLGPARRASKVILVFGAGALAFGGPASGQTVADNATIAPGQSPAACTKYRHDPASDAQCAFNEAVKESARRAEEAKARAAAAHAEGVAAEKRTACNLSLQDEIKGKPDRIQAVRLILAGKSIREVDPCSVLDQLKKG